MKLRPRFRYEIDNLHSSQARNMILDQISQSNQKFEVVSNDYYLHIFLPKGERKLWTPHLSVTFENQEPGVIIRANIGPHSSIWMPFAFLYSAIGTAILFIAIYGLTQISLSHQAPILWLLIPLFAAMGAMYLTSYIGQRKSAHCIDVLKPLVEEIFASHPNLVVLEG